MTSADRSKKANRVYPIGLFYLAKALANAQDLIKRMTKILKEKLGDRLHISAKVWRGAGLKASENPTKPPKQKPERDTGLKR
ncbi:hypothetical protein HHK02_11020 [Limosilactobacillus reuteri]|uniref:Uncharacterized protein n=1 Tax=Limosilactobacillus reuteri TaxID=1598 RepID=A0A7L6BHC9_LIMRT|nr:hypothetical protein [Limosilactobacillus reuteri]QLQ61638.1 hypothetical protein HHK02_11020 [Limosilactobacillus reuteri]